MSDLESRCENCERDIEQLRSEVAEVMEVVGGLLARVDEVLTKVEICNRQLFADLQAQTDAGFASLQARIDALPLPLSEHKKDEPPKLN
jgi:predicted  nucleic acid-binding Zn-ribbon protein